MTNNTRIDLRSDAVTLPDAAMRRAMAAAEVGCDDFGEDPTIQALESEAASRLGKQAALFVHSGTMANLLAILVQTCFGQTVAAGQHSHIFDHEYRGVQRLAGVSLRPLPETTTRGRLAWDQAVLRRMSAEPPQSRPTLLCLEQTNNRLGGVVMPLDQMEAVAALARASGISIHLDGARLYNAACTLGVGVEVLAQWADTVMLVFTKALGAPAGAVLAGPTLVIQAARQLRHSLGGGYKQGGVLAAACLAALENTGVIADDHRRARTLAAGLADLPELGIELETVVSNLILVDVRPLGLSHDAALAQLEAQGVLASRARTGVLRLALHRDICDEDLPQVIEAFRCLAPGVQPAVPAGSSLTA